jgi:hypothetical protein
MGLNLAIHVKRAKAAAVMRIAVIANRNPQLAPIGCAEFGQGNEKAKDSEWNSSTSRVTPSCLSNDRPG